MKGRDEDRHRLETLTLPETPEPGSDPKPWSRTRVIGKPLPRIDAYQRVSGAAVYPSDILLPDMLYGALLGCPHPHAMVEKIDVIEAEKMPGVRAIITGSTPGADIKWRSGKSRLFDQHCRFEGDAVAALAADTPYQAWDAIRTIAVSYRVLPFVADERRALEPGAPVLHGKTNQVGNVDKYERGDVDKGFAESDVVLECDYRTESEIHTPMELHGCVAQWTGDLLTVWESTQGVFAVQEMVATALGLPLSKVRVIGRYMGGGFGSKLQTGKYSVAAALLARASERPVKLLLTREQTFLVAGNRPPSNMKLKAGAKAFGWKEARKKPPASADPSHIRTGVGMASCLWVAGDGGPPSTITLTFFPDASVNLNMGASDIGTGTKTIMAMVVAEELGITLKKIQIECADTGTTEYATPSAGSKTVPTEAPAVRAAAIHVKQQLLKMAADELRTTASALTLRRDAIVLKSDPSKKIKITGLAELKQRGAIVGRGIRGPNPQGKVVTPFGAQFCEVSVNVKTGEVEIVRFVAAHDSGRVMNRLTYDSQVIGGITMGIGLGTTEARILDRHETGKLCNRNWHDYKLPTALDVPTDIVSVPIELGDDECNTTGAKGLGEPVTIPTAAAIANAVYHATGIRVTGTPINAVQLSRLLAEHKSGLAIQGLDKQ